METAAGSRPFAWRRWRAVAFAAAPGPLCVLLREGSCATALLASGCALVVAHALARALAQRPGDPPPPRTQLPAFLAAAAALLALTLLALPAPRWLASPTNGRWAVLLLLSLVAAAGTAVVTARPAPP